MPIFRIPLMRTVLLLVPVLLVYPVPTFAIAKCQDADGKWHYGDNAAAACGDSRITVIDNTGRKVEEVEAPLTEEEIEALEAEKKREELEQKMAAKREMEKQRILAIYPSEDSIIRARDDRLSGMDRNIKLQEELLDSMRLELKEMEANTPPQNEKAKAKRASRLQTQQKNIDEYYQSITRLRRDREQTAQKYEKILNEFRELTGE